jgi:hypothetical protein
MSTLLILAIRTLGGNRLGSKLSPVLRRERTPSLLLTHLQASAPMLESSDRLTEPLTCALMQMASGMTTYSRLVNVDFFPKESAKT